ncbi:hypothetical protein [Methanonatronarchaeum sp. AMET-Sl]|uniref:hypothetical protein n=1 Tax=Methanonatronarchaeum sp. AMET-Sl TaxID=3037654 RepID=UPI00244E134C|nr:hypothetical protein [Methanonatronarchaeum sp. AMET-Sl]WGI17889.1 hypothetical protein QEN48_02465 [Methanonatronarchaeum sp. AMET-Sl]
MTDNFDPHINCCQFEKDSKLPFYKYKEINIDSRKYKNITTPTQAADMNGLSRKTLDIFNSLNQNQLIFDNTKIIRDPRTYEGINDIIEGYTNDTTKFLRIMGIKPNLIEKVSNAISVTSCSFHRDPFKERVSTYSNRKYPPLNKKNFDTFLHNLYSYSKGMVLVPDIRIQEIKNTESGVTVTLEEYKKRIDYFTRILSERNNKPIFVPIQTKLSEKTTRKILDFYESKGYTNIWINFSSRPIKGRNLAGLRTILHTLERRYDPTEFCIFYSHMKKEISPHIKDDKNKPSDIIGQFMGGEIIGSTTKKLSFFSKENDFEEYLEELGLTKSEYEKRLFIKNNKIFDPYSYYYYNPVKHPTLIKDDFISKKVDNQNNLMGKAKTCKAIDSYIKINETENLKRILHEKNTIRNYIKNKELLQLDSKTHSNIFENDQNRRIFNF